MHSGGEQSAFQSWTARAMGNGDYDRQGASVCPSGAEQSHSTHVHHSSIADKSETGCLSPRDQHLSLPPIPQPSPFSESPTPSSLDLSGHLTKQFNQLNRNNISSAKLARVAKYQGHSPEKGTIGTGYYQQYVDSGGWPQDSVLGA